MLYPKVNPEDFADLYAKHVSAMTEENLSKKSDIAAQLAWRDARIEALQEDLQSTLSMYQEGSPGCG